MKKALNEIDKPIFLISALVSIMMVIILLAAPAKSREVVNDMLHFMTYKLGFLYIIAYVVLVGFLIWLVFSKYGKIVLGTVGEKPEYDDFSWMAMMFCTGIASSLMIFSFIEPIYYLTSTPFGIEPMSVEAYEYAHMWPISLGAQRMAFLRPGDNSDCVPVICAAGGFCPAGGHLQPDEIRK